ncbi:threonyl-tRNA synthetase [Hypoxylon texense]
MSEPRSKSPQDGDASLQAQDDKPRLTEEEKKQNHIASEQKRREAIRAGFDKLCSLVPGLEGHGRSEGFVLKETVKYMRAQLIRRRELVQKVEAKGLAVSDELKEQVSTLIRYFLPYRPLRCVVLTCLICRYRPIKILERLEAREREKGLDGKTKENSDEDIS